MFSGNYINILSNPKLYFNYNNFIKDFNLTDDLFPLNLSVNYQKTDFNIMYRKFYYYYESNYPLQLNINKIKNFELSFNIIM